MWGVSPLGKFQVILQLSWGKDVTQRVPGVDEDETFDLHTLKQSVGQEKTLSSFRRQEPHGPTGRGWSLSRLPGKCDGTLVTTLHGAHKGRKPYLQHHL